MKNKMKMKRVRKQQGVKKQRKQYETKGGPQTGQNLADGPGTDPPRPDIPALEALTQRRRSLETPQSIACGKNRERDVKKHTRNSSESKVKPKTCVLTTPNPTHWPSAKRHARARSQNMHAQNHANLQFWSPSADGAKTREKQPFESHALAERETTRASPLAEKRAPRTS